MRLPTFPIGHGIVRLNQRAPPNVKVVFGSGAFLSFAAWSEELSDPSCVVHVDRHAISHLVGPVSFGAFERTGVQLQTPEADISVRNSDATLLDHTLYITEAEREPMVEPD